MTFVGGDAAASGPASPFREVSPHGAARSEDTGMCLSDPISWIRDYILHWYDRGTVNPLKAGCLGAVAAPNVATPDDGACGDV
jgi:hypothetical protein